MEVTLKDTPAKLSRTVKICILAVLLSLFVFNFYWVIDSYRIFFNYLAGEPEALLYVTRGGLSYWMAHVGLTARFFAVALGLTAVFLLWVKAQPFSKVKGLVAAALALEGIYFLGFFPSALMLMKPRFIEGIPGPEFQTLFLGAGYLLQVVAATPFLLFLAFKVYRSGNPLQKPNLRVWAGAAFAGYIAALGINAVFRWLDMVSLMGLPFLLTGIIAVGFLDAVVLMPLAIVFAVLGVHRLSKQKVGPALRWFGLALTAVGLSYTIYVVYSYAVNALKFALLVDVWTIPLLGLGVGLLLYSRKFMNKKD